VGLLIWRALPITVGRKLRLRLAIIAELPEPILLDRLRMLAKAELIVFRRFYGRTCRHAPGPCHP